MVRPRLSVTQARVNSAIRTGWLSAAAYAGMFGFGIVMALLGAVLPVIAARIHFDLAHAGDLFLVMNAAMLVTTIAIGPLLDRFGHKIPLIIGPIWVIAALIIISYAHMFPAILVACICLGIGGGALNQATNTLIADLYEDVYRKSAALNILGVFFGIGALFVPFTIGSLLHALGFTAILSIAMALSVVPVVLSTPFVFPPARQRKGVSAVEIWRLIREPLVLGFSFLLFFESGNEFILGGYLSTHVARNLGASVSTASYLLALYWGALMLGRIVLSRALLRKSGTGVVLVSAAAVASFMTLFLISQSIVAAAVFVFFVGFSTSAIFPTVLGLAGSFYASYSGTVFGILIGIALIGGMTLPWAVGKIAAASNLRRGLFLVVVDAVGILILDLLAQRLMKLHAHA